MRAVVITRPGGPDVLEVRDVPRPRPGYGQVLVRVRATALNRADLLQREGRYPAPPDAPPDIPGMELAGEVAELGPGVQMWRVGQPVFGIVGGGSYAEYVVTHERMLAEVPGLSWTDAAAVPEAFITAHDALVTQAGVRLSECVLVHAVGSGVGLAAAQLARAVGAVPYGTARTAEKIERARAFGLTDGIVLGSDLAPLQHAVESWAAGAPDVVLDLDDQVRVRETNPVTDRRTEDFGVGASSDAGHHTAPAGGVSSEPITSPRKPYTFRAPA